MPTLKISSCTVQLLDGSEFIIETDALKKGVELLDDVWKHVCIQETGYFGLKYTHQKDNKTSWFDSNKPLQKQIKKASNKFKFAVQFYPPSIQMIQDEKTRYLFVLQIRENLLTGIWSCPIPTQALLASYVVQAEMGDYDEMLHQDDYLKGFNFMFNQDEDFIQKTHFFHKKHVNLSSAEAEWLYLETARKIALYGMDVFDIMDGDGNAMRLSVNVNGIHILHMNTILHSFLWPAVTKTSHHGHEITLDLEYKDTNSESQEMLISFICPPADGKRIHRTCNNYKEFSYHGKPKIVSSNAGLKSGVKSKKQQAVETQKCSHVFNDVPVSSFNRVDNVRFSQKVLKKTGFKNESLHINATRDEKDALSVKRESCSTVYDSVTIPQITETLASDDENHELEKHEREESTDVQNITNAESSKFVIRLRNDDSDNEDVVNEKKIKQDQYEVVVPDSQPSDDNDAKENPPIDSYYEIYDDDDDDDVVVIGFKNAIELCQEKTI